MSRRSAFDNEMKRQIGARLRDLRAGRSQHDFASELGVGQAALANYEAGRRTPSSKLLERYAALGGVSVPWILTGFDAGDSGEFERRFRELTERLSSYRAAGVFPKAVVSDDEFAMLKVFRALRNDDALAVTQSLVDAYERQGARNRFVNREAARLRKLLTAGQLPESGVDFDALLEGFGIVSANTRPKPPAKG